jgi:hypothetical protein
MRSIKKAKWSSAADKEPKTVRIWLLPTPPPEMDHPRRSERLAGCVAYTDEPVQEETRLASGSHWGIHELKLLKVQFDPLDANECLSVLGDFDPKWSTAEEQGIGNVSSPLMP